MSQPLEDVRVVELAVGVSGPYCGKLLADFGADVVKVEPPDGDPARYAGPFPADVPDPEQSAMFLHLNTNKRSVTLDLAGGEGRETLRRLVRDADVVIESFAPGTLDSFDIGFEAMRALRPRIVLTSVTPFGQDGPYAGFVGEEIVYYAMGGPMHATGVAEREPVKLASNVVGMQAGNMAAVATIAALLTAQAPDGEAIHVDLSNFEAQAGSIDRRLFAIVQYAYSGTVSERNPATRAGAVPLGIYPAQDGYVQIITVPAWVPRMLATFGDEDLTKAFAQPGAYLNPALQEQVDGVVYGWLADRTKQQAMLDAQAHRYPVTAVNTPADVVDDPHFAQRGFFVDVEHPAAGRLRQPGPPVRMDDGWALRRPAPLLGEHTRGFGGLAGRRPAIPRGDKAEPNQNSPAGARLPLEGVRVIDLTVVWAGPYTTMLLGDLGAEVIRLDNPWIFPSSTKGFIPRVPEQVVALRGPTTAAFPDHDQGARPWNRHALFNCHARNKRMATIDLRKPSGRDAFMKLVEISDVLVENNAAKTMDELGLTWDVISQRNPRMVMMRMPPLGLSGPYRDFVGFGAHFEAISGLTAARGYADADPTTTTSTFHMDPASGTMGAFALMLALRRRQKTGKGEFIELPQAENMLQHIGDLLIDAARTGREHPPRGNRHPTRAPQGCYRCAGENRWAVISVGSDAEWLGLRKAMGDPDWARDARFASAEGRREHHDEIDRGIESWTKERSKHEVFACCQAARVPAGPVMNEEDLFTDPHLRSRGFFRPLTGDDTGTHEYPSHLWHWTGPALRWDTGPRAMGADNEYVYKELLGMDDAAFEDLRRDGHIALDYLAPDGTPL